MKIYLKNAFLVILFIVIPIMVVFPEDIGFVLKNPAFNNKTQLNWLPDGSGLIINKQWIFYPSDQKIEIIPEKITDYKICSSPSSKYLLASDYTRFKIGQITGEWGAWIYIPDFLVLEQNEDIDSFRFNVLCFISDNIIYLNQSEFSMISQSWLYICDENRWIRLKNNYLTGSFLRILRIYAGSDNSFAVYSAAEGLEAIDIVRYHPDTGQEKIPLPEIYYCPYYPPEVVFSVNPSELYLLSRSELTTVNKNESIFDKCKDIEHKSWKIFVMNQEGNLYLLYSTEQKSIISPKGDYVAWSMDGSVYLDKIGAVKKYVEMTVKKN